MRPPHSLDQLQKWMQAVITHPGGVAAGAAAANTREAVGLGSLGLEMIVLPSRTQTSAERLAVYSHAYVARLLLCLRELFPACLHAVGDDIFDDFALGYLQAYPPRSYTLGSLADRFVDYLEQTRIGSDASLATQSDAVEDWSRFLIELARLEQVIDDVFDGPGTETLIPVRPDQLTEIAPEKWPELRFELAPCLHILSFEFPVNEYFASFRRGEAPELPEPRRTHLAISRRDYVVRRYPLDESQVALLGALVVGATLGDALAAAARIEADVAILTESLSTWFEFWTRERFFASIYCHPQHAGAKR